MVRRGLVATLCGTLIFGAALGPALAGEDNTAQPAPAPQAYGDDDGPEYVDPEDTATPTSPAVVDEQPEPEPVEEEEDEDSYTVLEFVRDFVLGTATAPFWLPYRILDEGWERPFSYARYPYDKWGEAHLHTYEPDDEPEKGERRKRWSAQLAGDFIYQRDKVWRATARLRMTAIWRLELESNWMFMGAFDPKFAMSKRVVGDTDIMLRFAQSAAGHFRAGVGMRTLIDERGANSLWNFAYGFDLFLLKPFVLSATGGFGMRKKSPVVHGRATLGLFILRAELYGGYDFLMIGTEKLQGFVGGVRAWF